MARNHVLAALGAALAAVFLAGPAAAAPASLELHGPGETIALTSRNGSVLLDLGVSVAATGGAFELRVRRPDYDSDPEIVQVDARTGAIMRQLPNSVLRRWSGLRRFFVVTVRDDAGEVVVEKYFRFCPNNADQIPLSGESVAPRYPDACGSSLPFVRGMVWGIDDGWAVTAFGFLQETSTRAYAVKLAPGAYTAEVAIDDRYRELLAIPDSSAEVVVDFTVEPADMLRQARSEPRRDEPRAALGEITPPDMPHPDPALLPDLVALPAWNITLIEAGARDLLGFAASPWNAGPGPLVVDGFRATSAGTMEAYQYFYDGETPVGRTRAGSMAWDSRPGHDHWHFLQFSRYSLIDPEKGAILRSRKQSFCLAPTEPVDLTVPGAAWLPWSLSFTSVCGGRSAKHLREAMPVGWSDTYFQVVAGQAFDVTSLPNGRYQIEIEVNPQRLLHERSTFNNVARRTIILRGTKADRRVKVLPWHSIGRAP